MISLFGVPLFGALFVPLIVGLVSFFLVWKLFLSNKGFNRTVPSNNELQKPNASSESVAVPEAKGKSKERNKQCGGQSCCSSKDGKSASCCSSSKAIGAAKIFGDENSLVCKAYASDLSSKLAEACGTSEIIQSPEANVVDLPKYADGSLCIFLMDNSIEHDEHWVLKAINHLTNLNRSLTGMKYSVFLFHDAFSIELKVETIDQLLHKLGAVRVCKAESTLITSTQASNDFEGWAKELVAQVERWNAPKAKACKCGPKEKGRHDKPHGSSSCSTSDLHGEIEEGPNPSLLDVEDIARFL